MAVDAAVSIQHGGAGGGQHGEALSQAHHNEHNPNVGVEQEGDQADSRHAGVGADHRTACGELGHKLPGQVCRGNAQQVRGKDVGVVQSGVFGNVSKVVNGNGAGTEAVDVLGKVCQDQAPQGGVASESPAKVTLIGLLGLFLRGPLSLGSFHLGDLFLAGGLIALKHLEVCEVADSHQNTEGKSAAGVAVLLTQPTRDDTNHPGTHIGVGHTGDGAPGGTGGRQCRTVLWGLTGDPDHRKVCYPGDVPADMAGSEAKDDNDSCAHTAADLQELEGVQERHYPRQHNQPGAVAAPLHGLHLIQNDAVHPGEGGVDDAGDGADGGGEANAELGDIRQEVLEVIGLDIGHETEAQITNTEKCLQGFAEPLSLFLVLGHEMISSILSIPLNCFDPVSDLGQNPAVRNHPLNLSTAQTICTHTSGRFQLH